MRKAIQTTADCVIQFGISAGGTAAEHGGFTDRSCWYCSSADDALGHHTGTWVRWSSRLAREDWVLAAWVGQPLPFSRRRTRQYQSLLVICCSGLHCISDVYTVVQYVNMWTLECLIVQKQGGWCVIHVLYVHTSAVLVSCYAYQYRCTFIVAVIITVCTSFVLCIYNFTQCQFSSCHYYFVMLWASAKMSLLSLNLNTASTLPWSQLQAALAVYSHFWYRVEKAEECPTGKIAHRVTGFC